MFLESELWALPLARELGGEVRDVGRYSLMRASSGSPTGPVVHTCALTRHLWLSQCCSCQTGYLCQVNSVTVKALDKLYTRGPFGLRNSKCAFPWWGLCLEIEEKKTCFGKILMNVWEQGKSLSATSCDYGTYSFIRYLMSAYICQTHYLALFVKFSKVVIGWSPFFNKTLWCLCN